MADDKDKKDDGKRPIFVIKKIKKGGGHHGGAWKVAYADFVTAMMAFFLLMWLLNVTTEEQKTGISDFFDPNPQISQTQSGAGGMLGGLSMSTQGARSTDLENPLPNPLVRPPDKGSKIAEPDLEKIEQEKLEREVKRREEEEFKKVKDQIEQAMNASPELKEMLKNVVVDMTPEGLRIQIVDQEGASMFASGSSQMFDKTQKLMETVAGVIKTMPNQVSIRGHTDGAQYRGNNGYTNWELSADRANASRVVLMQGGIAASRIANVVGKADTDHFVKNNALDPKNRRISIILLHDKQTKESGANASSGQGGGGTTDDSPPAPVDPGYRPSSGSVQFP
jgi:chemotaxis protein MotB